MIATECLGDNLCSFIEVLNGMTNYLFYYYLIESEKQKTDLASADWEF